MKFNWTAGLIVGLLSAIAGGYAGALIGNKMVQAGMWHDEIYGGYFTAIPVGLGALVVGFLVGGLAIRRR